MKKIKIFFLIDCVFVVYLYAMNQDPSSPAKRTLRVWKERPTELNREQLIAYLRGRNRDMGLDPKLAKDDDAKEDSSDDEKDFGHLLELLKKLNPELNDTVETKSNQK
jgi:hypothetical protein